MLLSGLWLFCLPPIFAVELLGPGPVVLEAGGKPQDLLAADFDGDGALDLAVVNRGSDSVSVFLGGGLGGFSPGPGSPHDVANDPFAIASGDFDGNGRPDLAVVHRLEASVSVLLGDGEGGFGVPKRLPVGSPSFSLPTSIAVGDATGDGTVDIVVADPGDGTIRVLAGDGAGEFNIPREIPLTGSPSHVSVADIDGDSEPELLVAQKSGNAIAILDRTPAGEFVLTHAIPVGHGPASVAVADLNVDGVPDIVAVNKDDNTVTVLAGSAGGVFTPSGEALPTGDGPEWVAIADLDDDGHPDLVVNNSVGDSASVFLGRGNFVFVIKSALPVGVGPSSVTLADFNGDGFADMALPLEDAEDVRVFAGNGLGGFERTRGFHVGRQVDFVRIARFNADPHPDLVTGIERTYSTGDWGQFGQAGRVHRSDGRGGFSVPESEDPWHFCVRDSVHDMDGDGLTDRINWDRNELAVDYTGLSGEVEETLQFPIDIPPDAPVGGHVIRCVDAADFNGDGVLDLLVTHEGDIDRHWFRSILLGNGGRGGYRPLDSFRVLQEPDTGVFTGGHHPPALLADLNGDGRDDYVATGGNDGAFGSDVRLADETGRLDLHGFLPVILTSGFDPRESDGNGGRAAFKDVDGDGDVDVVGITSGARIVTLPGDGTGIFQEGDWDGADGYHRLSVADLNADGYVDLVAVRVGQLGGGKRAVDLLLGDGTGGFTKVARLAGADFPLQPDTGDLDGDGLPDLALADAGQSGTDGGVALLYNQLGRRADINGSNRVDGFDLSVLARLFGKQRGQVGFRANADVNIDGVVDGMDLCLVAERFGEIVQTVSPLLPSVMQAPDAAPHTVTLQPADDALGGDRVRVDIVVHETTVGVSGAEFGVAFDPATLRFVDDVPGDYLTGNSGFQTIGVTPGSPGRLRVTAGRIPTNSEVVGTGPATLVGLVFEAREQGQAAIDLDGVDDRPPRFFDAQGEVRVIQFVNGSVVTVEEAPGGPPGERITVQPDRVEFGGVDVGVTARRTLRIANIGFAKVRVSNITVELPEFDTFFTSPFTIGPSGFVELTVTFRPTAAAGYKGTLIIENDDRPISVPVQGVGQ